MTRELTASVGRQNISLRDGAAALFRRKGLVLLTFLTVIAGTVLVTLVLPDKYESRMKILVKNQRVDVAITARIAAASAMADGKSRKPNQFRNERCHRDLLTRSSKSALEMQARWLSRTPPRKPFVGTGRQPFHETGSQAGAKRTHRDLYASNSTKCPRRW